MESVKEFLESFHGEINFEMEQLMAQNLSYCLLNSKFVNFSIETLHRVIAENN